MKIEWDNDPRYQGDYDEYYSEYYSEANYNNWILKVETENCSYEDQEEYEYNRYSDKLAELREQREKFRVYIWKAINRIDTKFNGSGFANSIEEGRKFAENHVECLQKIVN